MKTILTADQTTVLRYSGTCFAKRAKKRRAHETVLSGLKHQKTCIHPIFQLLNPLETWTNQSSQTLERMGNMIGTLAGKHG